MSTNNDIEDIGRITFDPSEQPSKIMPRDWYRMLRMLAIHESHIAHLFRQTHGTKRPDFDSILMKIADDFGVPYEKLRDVSFEGYS